MIGRVHNGNSGFNMQNKTCLALQSNCRKGSGTSQHIFVLFSLSRLLLSGMSGVISANIHKNAISASLCRTNLLNIIQETVFLTALSTLSLRWRSPIISLSWFKAAGILLQVLKFMILDTVGVGWCFIWSYQVKLKEESGRCAKPSYLSRNPH